MLLAKTMGVFCSKKGVILWLLWLSCHFSASRNVINQKTRTAELLKILHYKIYTMDCRCCILIKVHFFIIRFVGKYILALMYEEKDSSLRCLIILFFHQCGYFLLYIIEMYLNKTKLIISKLKTAK